MSTRIAYAGAVVLALAAGAALLSIRDDEAAVSAQAAPTCDSAEHRQFDFWVGEWEVTTPDGQVAGRSAITRALGDCVIHERWTGAGGMRGESFNIWDRARGVWHQTWVNTRGELLVLEGTFENGAMRMSGESGSGGARVTNRITWTPGAGRTVQQLWETSTDAGQTWQVVFDGTYRGAN